MTTRRGPRPDKPTESERPAPTRSANSARPPAPTAEAIPSPVSRRSGTRSDHPTAIEKPAPLKSRAASTTGEARGPRHDSTDSRATRVERDQPLEARTREAGSRKSSRAPLDATKQGHYAERYEIRGLLGVGGMAAVYRAKDSWLGDDVALKVLSRDHGDTPEAIDRFRREASLARRITHPNVIRVFDVGTAGGEHFLTMQLVDGAPLLTRMTGPLSLQMALTIGAQLARALDAVHAAGVFHGDVKPENVLLDETNGLRVVLTDFGVSRRLEDPPPPPLPGHAGGTPIYMAPEQIEGRALGAKTDLYALGIVLYELIAGVPPWSLERGSKAAMMSRLAIPPTSLRLKNPDVPPELDELVLGLLEREPSKRPRSSRDVASRLETWLVRESEPKSSRAVTTEREGRASRSTLEVSASGVVPARSLAVLEMRANGEGRSGYLAEAFTHELIERLSRAARVRVASRMAQKLAADTDDERRALAKKLEVDALIDGQLALRADGALEVTVRLLDAETATEIWKTTAERKAQDIFKLTGDLADEIARAFAPAPEISSPGFVATDPPPAPTSSSSSVSRRSDGEALLRAREAWNSGTADDTFRAERMLAERHADAKDDAQSSALLAIAKLRRWTFDPRVSEGRASLADEASALLEPFDTAAGRSVVEVLFAHALLDALRLRGRDAIVHLRDATRLDPTFADAHLLLGQLYGEIGEAEASERALQQALKLDESLIPAAATLLRNLELSGKRSRADEWIVWGEAHGPEHPEMLLSRLRVARWRRDQDSMKTLRARAVRSSEAARGVVASALRVAAGANEDVELGRLAASAAMTGAAPAMTVKWMEIIAEQCAHSGDLPGVLSAIRSADNAGSVDVIWLEGCPLLEKVRSSNALGQARTQFAARARDIRSGR